MQDLRSVGLDKFSTVFTRHSQRLAVTQACSNNSMEVGSSKVSLANKHTTDRIVVAQG